MIFLLELMLAELIFLYPAQKRSRFPLRLLLILALCIAGQLLFPAGAVPSRSLPVQFVSFAGLFLLTVAAMGFCFRLSVPSLFSLCVAGYAVEHIAYHVAKIVQTLTGLFVGASLGALEDWELMELVVFPPVYLIALGTIGYFAARNECWKKTDLRFNALSIAVVFICVGLTRVANFYGVGDSVPVSIYAVTCCVMSLVVQFVLYRTVDLRMENTALNLMWQEERKQYEPSLDDIAAVNADYKDSFTQYGDAAIVVISRASGESHDYLPGGVVPGLGMDEPLALSQNERDAIALAKECSDKVIVLINSSSAVEIAELKNDPEVDAILWIGAPGAYGMLGVADILCGKVSPSGGLFDIFAARNMSAPAMQNMGNFRYANADGTVVRGGGMFGGNTGMYIMEAEGIYVGYRYYETRYYDCVAGQGNADSKAGVYASAGNWNYDDEVAYGFGYGLSYTTFSFDFEGEPEFKVEKKDNGSVDATATFNVKVTNTGKVAGKTSVQIYGQAPYTPGGLEKSAIQLLNYDKSQVLQPGESEVVSVVCDLQYIASYDMSLNGEGGYVLDPGTYYFAVGNGAHAALQNIMAKQGLAVEANADNAYEREIDESFIERTAFSVSKTGEKIVNQIPYSDWNYFQPGEVTYLSRSDWAGTWPKTYDQMTLTNQELIDDLNGKYYTIATDDDTSDIIWEEDNGTKFFEMWGVDYDDPKWERLINNMTLEEAQYLATYGGPSIPGAETIGTVETYMTENAGNGVAVNLNASKDTGAPWNIAVSDPNGNWHPEVFGNSPLTASSFNPQLCYDLGAFVGEESLFTGIPILWGPGLNTHRHAYNGRNGEYYSEDPILSGVTAMEFAVGALEYGLIAAPKHYAFNDQETNRSGVAPYMTEQRAREVELRAYQYAFEATKYDTPEFDQGMRGLMISFSKIGPVECTASVGLMTNILAKEWGFRGYAVTDIYDDFDIYGAVLTSGATCYDTRGMAGFYTNTTLDGGRFADQVDGSVINAQVFAGDATAQNAIKASVHKILFAMSQSNLMNRYDPTTRVVKLPVVWRTAYQTAEYAFGALMVCSAVLYLVAKLRKKEEK